MVTVISVLEDLMIDRKQFIISQSGGYEKDYYLAVAKSIEALSNHQITSHILFESIARFCRNECGKDWDVYFNSDFQIKNKTNLGEVAGQVGSQISSYHMHLIEMSIINRNIDKYSLHPSYNMSFFKQYVYPKIINKLPGNRHVRIDFPIKFDEAFLKDNQALFCLPITVEKPKEIFSSDYKIRHTLVIGYDTEAYVYDTQKSIIYPLYVVSIIYQILTYHYDESALLILL